MQQRKGITPQALQQLFDYARSAGEVAGVKLDFNKIRLAVNSTLSHLLIDLAPKKIKNEVVEAVYKAYFEDGLNIGDIDILVAIGTAAGMDSSELCQKLSDETAQERIITESTLAQVHSITSVPFFIINNKVKVDGSHSVKVFLQALNRATLIEKSA